MEIMPHSKKAWIYHVALGLIVILFIVFKWEALHLPFFWDEAWVYMPAIRAMADNGPSLLPGCIDPNLYTGHPLLFYYLAATWINLFGYSLPVAHAFPMLISISLLWSIYFISFKWSKSYFVAITSVLLVFMQPIFLTQSTFLLIEVWLALLFVWTFYFYFNRQYFGFSIVMLLALWSKESAFVLVPCFLLVAAHEWFYKHRSAKESLLLLGNIILVFALGFSFFILQKIKLGWYFFPRHANWINFSDLFYKFKLALQIVFIDQMRFVIFLFGAASFAYTYKSFKAIETKLLTLLMAIGILVFGFILFASINFFSSRYLFACIPLAIMVCAFFIAHYVENKKQYMVMILLLYFGASTINRSIKNPIYSDVELSYTRLLQAEVGLVNHLEKNPPTAQTYTSFLIHELLSYPQDGFVKEKIHELATDVKDTANVFFIAAPNEPDPYLDSLISNKLVKEVFSSNYQQAWIKIYQK